MGSVSITAMRLDFVKDNDSYIAIVFNEVYDKQICEELWFAEIDRVGKNYVVRWEDNFKNKEPFSSFHQAREYVKNNYHLHKPQIVGKRFQIIKNESNKNTTRTSLPDNSES